MPPLSPAARTLRLAILLAPLPVAAFVLLVIKPLAQDQRYHGFADNRTLWGIPHFGDVVTNVPFVLVGLWGMVASLRHIYIDPRERPAVFTIFLATLLTGFGSAYFHWNPNDATLMWDRLPMGMGFMAFFCVMLTERVSAIAGPRLLWPLVILGAGSVLLWAATGDLRLYALVQFYPVAATFFMLALLPPRYSHSVAYWLLLAFYVLSKLTEHFDHEIYDMTGRFLSGHNLKHLLAAAAPGALIPMLRHRRPA